MFLVLRGGSDSDDEDEEYDGFAVAVLCLRLRLYVFVWVERLLAATYKSDARRSNQRGTFTKGSTKTASLEEKTVPCFSRVRTSMFFLFCLLLFFLLFHPLPNPNTISTSLTLIG
jgi:hypothetical protein